MSELKKKAVVLALPVWGLPGNIDAEDLSRKASTVSRKLEVIGCYNQRNFAPACIFSLTKAK